MVRQSRASPLQKQIPNTITFTRPLNSYRINYVTWQLRIQIIISLKSRSDKTPALYNVKAAQRIVPSGYFAGCYSRAGWLGGFGSGLKLNQGDDIRSDGSVEIRANCLLLFEGNSDVIEMFGVVLGIASMLLR